MSKILMLLENEFPSDDRVEKEALSLINAGYTVHLLCPDFSGRPTNENHKGIHIHRFSINKTFLKKLLGLIQILPLYKLFWLKKVRKIINEQKANIVHIHDLPLCCLIQTLKTKFNLKIVADMHENYPAMVAGQEHLRKIPNKFLIKIGKWYKLEKKWLRLADLIICTASGMIKRLSKQLEGEHNFVLVPNTLDINTFQLSQTRKNEIEEKFRDSFNILSYGVVSEQRGIQFVLEAVSKLKDKIPKIRLIVLGDGTYLSTLKMQAKNLGIEKNVAFEGWQNQSYLISYMENTHIAIIPHLKSEHTDNTSPNKLFHFMYFKKPVLASNCNYIQEIVEQEKCGIIYKYDSPDELADAIERLYGNENEQSEMGRNGYMGVMNNYNWQSTIKPLLEKYNNLIN